MPPLLFSAEEKLNLMSVYFSCHRNSTDACREYFRLYPEKRQPHRTLFRKLELALKEKGSFRTPKKEGPPSTNEDYEATVLAHVFQYSRSSLRETEKVCGVPRTSAHRILKRHRMRPYKLKAVQGLHVGDGPRRMDFCRWVI